MQVSKFSGSSSTPECSEVSRSNGWYVKRMSVSMRLGSVGRASAPSLAVILERVLFQQTSLKIMRAMKSSWNRRQNVAVASKE
jgi:hypothetical protein